MVFGTYQLPNSVKDAPLLHTSGIQVDAQARVCELGEQGKVQEGERLLPHFAWEGVEGKEMPRHFRLSCTWSPAARGHPQLYRVTLGAVLAARVTTAEARNP